VGDPTVIDEWRFKFNWFIFKLGTSKISWFWLLHVMKLTPTNKKGICCYNFCLHHVAKTTTTWNKHVKNEYLPYRVRKM